MFEKLAYKCKNWASLLRAYSTLIAAQGASYCGAVTMVGTLEGKLTKADGTEVDLGLLGARSVTNAGVNYMAADFLAASASRINAFKWHDCGTGVAAENVTDTALGTPAGVSRVSGTDSNPSSNVYRSVATISFTGALAITEHGLFSASTVGTLWDRTVFTAINVANGDSIQFTYNLTVNAGG